MLITIDFDNELLAQAHLITGVTERTQLLHEALLALVQRESARRLAKLGATQTHLQPIPRQRDVSA